MKTHILIVIHSLEMGGAENYAIQLANQMILSEDKSVSIAYGKTDNLFLLNKLSKNVNKIEMPGVKYHFLNYFLHFFYLLYIINKLKITIVQSLLPRTTIPAVVAGKFMSKKLFYTPMFADNENMKSLKFTFFNLLLNYCSVDIIALSDYIAEKNISYGLKKTKVFTIPLGIDTERFNFNQENSKPKLENTYKIGIVSRLEDVKDVASGLKIFKHFVEKANLPAQLIIVGDGILRAELEQLAETLKISQAVSFLGKMANTEKIYSTFDMYLQVTKGPNLGLSALEALSSGVPLAIYTRNPEEVKMAEDTLSGIECGAVLPTDYSEAAKVMLNTLQSERLEAIRANARRLAVEKYSLNKHIEMLLTSYDKE